MERVAGAGPLQDKNDYLNNYRAWAQDRQRAAGAAARSPACSPRWRAGSACRTASLVQSAQGRDDVPDRRRLSLAVGVNVTGGTERSSISSRANTRTRPAPSSCPTSEKERLLTARSERGQLQSTIRPNTNRPGEPADQPERQPAGHRRQTNVGYVTSTVLLPQNDNNVLGMLPTGFFGKASRRHGRAGSAGRAAEQRLGLLRAGRDLLAGAAAVDRAVYLEPAGARRVRRPGSTARTVGYDIANRTENQFDPTGLGPTFSTTTRWATSSTPGSRPRA